MGLEKLFPLAVLLSVLAAGTGQLPRILVAVRVAQLKLIKASQSSSWGPAILLPIKIKKGGFR